jgi:glutamine synthetase
VLQEIKERVGENFTEQDEILLKLDIHKTIPELLLDNTDRNRTSPFAFTGNKFEFRAVGSSANCAIPMATLNAIMAKTLELFKAEVDGLIEKGEKKEVAIMEVIKKYIVDAEKVLFEGDGYSDEWHAEAEKRGLPNVPTTPRALDAFVQHKALDLFESMNILSHTESEARHEIMLEDYIKRVQIEGRIIGELVTSHIMPAAVKYQNVLIENIRGLKEIGMAPATYANQLQVLEKITMHINQGADLVEKMIGARKKANVIEGPRDKAIAYCEEVKPYFDEIRYHVDKLELHIDDNFWPLPKYREMLFLR